MNRKINKVFFKKPKDERDVIDKKYNLKSIYTDGYSCSLVFEKNIELEMDIKRKEKASEGSTPKIKKIAKTIKKIVTKKRKVPKMKAIGKNMMMFLVLRVLKYLSGRLDRIKVTETIR